ncbi:hypothetical protein C8Q77DRAFT_1112373 [Trametes polyzona]|nr:hypothetical protein C8Q77DRAFT_1112373 [Trametes polyzona]
MHSQNRPFTYPQQYAIHIGVSLRVYFARCTTSWRGCSCCLGQLDSGEYPIARGGPRCLSVGDGQCKESLDGSLI